MGKYYEAIEGYADMTAEEKLAALEAFETDDSEVKKWKAQFDKASHEAAESKKQIKSLQDQINSRMSDDEKAKAEREQELADIIAERDSLKRESAVNKLVSRYIALGYSEELATSTAEAMLDGDTDKVLSNQAEFNKSLEQTYKANSVKSNPTPDGKGTSTHAMTKSEIMAIKDTAKRQKAIAENIGLFE